MDLTTVTAFRRPRSRDDLALGAGEALLAGGTWLYSQPNEHLCGLVDLTALGWPDVELDDGGLTLAATCPIEVVAGLSAPGALPPEFTAAPLFRQCAEALLASFKIQRVATIGGNLCTALPAGSMTSLATALDASVLLWRPDGTERRMRAVDFVQGVQRTALEPAEVVRSVEFPAQALRARTAFRKLALSPIGRSGSLVTGRVDPDGAATFSITAATERPYALAFPGLPVPAELRSAVEAIGTWYDDPHGAPDWRRATTMLLAEQVRRELADDEPEAQA